MDGYRAQALPNMKKTVDSLETTINSAKNYLTSKRNARIGDLRKDMLNIEETKKGAAVKIR